METVDLLEILYSLRRRWALILMICIITTLLVGIYSFFIATPVYEATVSMYVFKNISSDQNSITYNDMLLNNQMAKNYKELILSRNVLNEVIDNLDLHNTVTYSDLTKHISVNLKQDTSYLLISVKNIDAQLAADIANEISEVFAYKVQEIMKIENVKVIDAATVPAFPVSPNKKLNLLLGFVIGLMLGVLLVIAIDFFDTRIKFPEDVKRKFDYPLLGAIPIIDKEEDADVFIKGAHKYLISDNAKLFETYRTARTNIMFSNIDNPYKTILITSSVPGEGKTSFSANLAMSFAKAGKKTLIIDVDLRRPRLHKAFRLNTVKGLTSVLAAGIEVERAIKTDVMENLDVLPAGIRPPNPAELLGSAAMKNLIKELREIYDVVILDSPPVSVFSDAANCATEVDAVIYVVSCGVAHHNELARGIENLKNVNANIAGFIMTRVETDAKGRDYYNYKYSYNYEENIR